MPNYTKNPIRFTREWNTKRIALVFLVQACHDFIGNKKSLTYFDHSTITAKNSLDMLSEIPDGTQKDALAWFVDEWTEKTFSFNWVCDTLDISRAEYRRRLIDGDLVVEAAKLQVAFID